MSEIVYLDICCFKRPFDNASIERIRREAEAVAMILKASESGHVKLVRSPAHDFENDRNPREDRRLATALWLEAAEVIVASDSEGFRRARELENRGFAALDALHLAFAEKAPARWFVTTDDRLLRVAERLGETLDVRVLLPDTLIESMKEDAGE